MPAALVKRFVENKNFVLKSLTKVQMSVHNFNESHQIFLRLTALFVKTARSDYIYHIL